MRARIRARRRFLKAMGSTPVETAAWHNSLIYRLDRQRHQVKPQRWQIPFRVLARIRLFPEYRHLKNGPTTSTRPRRRSHSRRASSP